MFGKNTEIYNVIIQAHRANFLLCSRPHAAIMSHRCLGRCIQKLFVRRQVTRLVQHWNAVAIHKADHTPSFITNRAVATHTNENQIGGE